MQAIFDFAAYLLRVAHFIADTAVSEVMFTQHDMFSLSPTAKYYFLSIQPSHLRVKEEALPYSMDPT